MELIETIDVRQALRAQDFTKLRDTLARWEPSVIAAEIRDLSVEDQAIVFRILPRGCAAEVFEFLDLSAQQRVLRGLGQEQVAAILNDMAADDRTALLEDYSRATFRPLQSPRLESEPAPGGVEHSCQRGAAPRIFLP